MHKELLSKALLTDKYLYVGVVFPDGEVEVSVVIRESSHIEWYYNFDHAVEAQTVADGDYHPISARVAATIALDLFMECSAQREAQR